MPNAAGQIWPHLKTDEPPRQQQRAQSLAGAMWPTLGPQPKPPTNRESLRRHLQEAVANIDARIDARRGR